ncbi:low molecular weight phosphatase family protein [Mycolicibacterium sp. F2034L]|uniref:arsenate reductase/protein-tyrosine-phosphatase family protein n=1 Tax=Mycolicibacterium sp. F2034L TaxID=2926422 RepID=UPI001FF20486|nr:low molecular weight phosphatase family protein [Mycolicibacterium sp. F2034L]MCK0173781.1 low molecular weight phosphatase family protein [Mycolicibacterium sp. F2034L]
MESTLHILFVCTGNICRSPTAERLAAAHGAELGISDLETSSAGTRAVIGHAIHPQAARVLDSFGGRSTDFAARQLTTKIAASADIILTMTRSHRDAVLGLAPRKLNRTFTLTEAAYLATEGGASSITDLADLRPHCATHQLADIPDPIGQSDDVFDFVGGRIASLLPPVLRVCQGRQQ